MTIDAKDLHVDYKRVNNAESRMSLMGQKIRTCEASQSEIINWYYSQDPLYEAQTDLWFIYDLGRKDAGTELLRQRNLKYITFERGADILIAGTVFPELFTEGSFKGRQKLDAMMTKEAPSWMIGNGDREAPLSLDDIVNFSINKMRFRSYSLDDLKKLYIAADMITMASNIGDVRLNLEDRQKTRKIHQTLASEIYHTVYEHAIESTDFETKVLGLKAKWMYTGINIPYAKIIKDSQETDLYKNEEQTMCLDMINAIEKVYLNQDSMDLSKGELRGSLHELIWFLDFSMLSLHENENSIVALPAWFFQDAPKIDYPKNNRGYDYQIQNIVNGAIMFLQLKSKEQPHFRKDYHPLITVVTEKNFNDFQKNRLRAKLNKYRDFIETGSEEAWDLASTYLLGSVNEVWNKLHNQKDNIRDQTKTAYLETQRIPKNKSARRRLMKDLKKRGIDL